jgi:hypothetical protein
MEPPIVGLLLALPEFSVFRPTRTTVEPLTPTRQRDHHHERHREDRHPDPKLHGLSLGRESETLPFESRTLAFQIHPLMPLSGRREALALNDYTAMRTWMSR